MGGEEHKAAVGGLFDALAGTYDTVIPFFETFAGHLVREAALAPGERVLDVASGTGRCSVTAAAAVAPGGAVEGIDLSAGMVARARELAAPGLPVTFRVGDAEHLPFEPGRFDAALCGFGVFFFPDPRAALSEVRRVLEPGGRFAATTFVDAVAGFAWHGSLLAATTGRPPAPPSAVATASGLASVLEAVGFADVRAAVVEGRFRFPDVDAYLAWCWSTGHRGPLAALPPADLERFRAGAAEHLREDHELVQRVHVTTAVSRQAAGPAPR